MRTTRPDLSIAVWRKSSHSMNDDGCIEVADQFPGIVPVRDSKDPDRPGPIFSATSWSSFVSAVAATNGDLSA
ncbi:DUF397 domain-containing protein [Streptomyces abikoensis]